MTTLAEVEVLVKANLDPLIKASKNAEMRAVDLERKLDKALSKAPIKAQGEFKKLNDVLRSTSAIVGTLAGSVAAGLFARVVREFATFEQGMKNVQAVSGATKKELKLLGDAALKAAATTRFNPKQATDALYALASSGQTATQQIASLPNVLNFAEAAQANLGQSTEIVTSTLNVFGIEAAQSARVADVFTAAIGASALNADRIAVAMRNAGPTASALGQSFEATTASLGILTSAFGNGERAGTGLRAILVEMGDKAKDLGIKVKNSKGEFLPLVDVLRQIEQRGITSTQIIETFGAEAGPALAALLSKGSDALVEMESRIQSNGQAAKVAAEQLNTLSGDFAGLQSAISAAMVSIGESQSGSIREVTQALTNLIRLWSGYADTLGDARAQTESLSNLIAVMAGILATRVVAGAMTATAAMGSLSAATAVLSGALRVLGLTNPLGILITAVGAATYAFLEFKDSIQPIEGSLATLGDYGAVAWQKITSAANEASQVFSTVASKIEEYISAALGGAEISFSDFASFVKSITNTLVGYYVTFYETVVTTFTKLPAAIADSVVSAMNSMIAGIEKALNKVVSAVNSVLTSINSVGGEFGLSVGTLSGVELGRIANKYEGAGAAAGAAYAKAFDAKTKDYLGDALGGITSAANQRARARADTEANGPENTFSVSSATKATSSASTSAKAPTLPGDSKGGKGKKAKESESDFAREAKAIKERTAALIAETQAMASLNPLVNDYGFAVEKARAAQELETAAKQSGLALTPELKKSIDDLATGYANAAVEAEKLAESQDKIKQRAEEMNAFGKDVFKGFITDIQNGTSAADALKNALGKIVDKLLDIALNSVFSGGGGLGGLFGSLFGGFPGFANGTNSSPGGLAMVGERGPELVNLPGGSKVYPAAKTRSMLSNMKSQESNSSIHVTFGVSADGNGNIAPFVESVTDQKVGSAIARNNAAIQKEMPKMVYAAQKTNQQRGRR